MAPKRKPSKKSTQGTIFENQSEIFEGKRYFKDPKKISEHLICGICQDVFNEPWGLTCGHVFCKDCIDSWIKTNPTCPIDRKQVSVQHSTKIIPLANIIGDLTIACPWRPYGCTLIDKYYIVKDHGDKCIFNPNKMDPFMQEEMKKIVPRSPRSPHTRTSSSTPQVSGLDELMAQLEDGALDDSIVEDDASALPEVEMQSLKCRLYMNQERSRDIMATMFAPKDDPLPKRKKK